MTGISSISIKKGRFELNRPNKLIFAIRVNDKKRIHE